MDKQVAAEPMQEVLKLTAQLNVIAAKVESVTPASELPVMRRQFGT